MADPIGGVWAIKTNEFQPTNYVSTGAGIQAALDHVAGGGLVMVGPGTFTITAPLVIGNNVVLRGYGRTGTIILADPAFSGSAMITNADYAGAMQWCAVENLSVWGNKTNSAVVAYGIYFKGIGQPTRLRDVSVDSCSGIGVYLEGIATNLGNLLADNVGVSNCPLGSFVIGPLSCGYTLRDCNAETVDPGVAAVLVSGPDASNLFPGTVLIDAMHIEGLGAASIGVHINNARNVHVKDLIYLGSGNAGNLVQIDGTSGTLQSVILENVTAYVGSVANGLVDNLNSITIANGGSGVNIPMYIIGAPKIVGSPNITGSPTITGPLAVSGNLTVGTAGTAQTTTVGGGGSNAAGADLIVNSGSTGATQARLLLERNASADLLLLITGSGEQIQFRNGLQFGTTAGAAAGYMTTTGKLRLGDGSIPTQQLEVAGSILSSALTSGKYPKASTGGLIVDGPAPLAGTKVYYVSDTSGGTVNRKLTFTDGILTAET